MKILCSEIKNQVNIKVLVGLVCIIATLFSIVLVRVETRRMGYEVVKLVNLEKKSLDQFQKKLTLLANLNDLSRVKKVAQDHLELGSPKKTQILYLPRASLAKMD